MSMTNCKLESWNKDAYMQVMAETQSTTGDPKGLIEEEDYNEEEDVDFDPSNANEGSEEDEEEEEFRSDGHGSKSTTTDYSRIESDTGGLVRTRKAKQLEEERRKRQKYETLQTASVSEDVKDIWQELKQQASRRLQKDVTKSSVLAEDDPTNPDNSSETQILIKRNYKFAGEMIHEEKMVPMFSAEAKEYLNSLKFQQKTQEETTESRKESQEPQDPQKSQELQKRKDTKSNLRRPLKRPPLLEQIISGTIKPKLTTLEKSSLDWASYVDKEGINEELTLHNKDGYLAKQDFLNRVESFKDQKYKDFRQKQLSMQLQNKETF